jgi:hypothetical protein
MTIRSLIAVMLVWVFKMDRDAWGDVFHDAGLAIMTVGAAAAYSGSAFDATVGLIGGFAIIRIGHLIRKG